MSTGSQDASVAVVKVVSRDPLRLGKFDLIISYVPEGSLIPLTFIIPDENSNKGIIEAAIRKHYSDYKTNIPTKIRLG